MALADQQRGFGQEPRTSPAVRWLSILLALALIGLAAVAIRELWIHYDNTVTWQSWVEPVLGEVAVEDFQPWMQWASVIAIVVGLVFLIAALKPRRRTHIRLDSPVSMWARPTDVARMVSATVKRQAGVRSVTTSVRGKKVKVEAESASTDPAAQEKLEQAVDAKLHSFVGSDMRRTVQVSTPEPTEAAKGSA